MTAKRPLPPHGTRACYIRGCRRPECAADHYRYMSRYRLDRERGQRRRVPAGPTRSHVRELLDAGWLQSQIAAATTCSPRAISAIARDKVTDISPLTERRLLALPVGPPPTAHYVDATGTMRRVQALVAIGHTVVDIATAIGMHHSALSRVAIGELDTVRAATATATARVYRQRALIPGTSKRARNHAAKHGWHSPLAWDEDTIDDPDARPEVDIPPTAAPTRDELAAQRRAEILHLDSYGICEQEIAVRVGLRPQYVHDLLVKLRQEHYREAA